MLLLNDRDRVVHDSDDSRTKHAAFDVDRDLAGLWILESALERGGLLLEDIASHRVGDESGAGHHSRVEGVEPIDRSGGTVDTTHGSLRNDATESCGDVGLVHGRGKLVRHDR